MTIQTTPLFSAVTATGAQASVDFISKGEKNFVAFGLTTAGSGAAKVRVEGSTGNGQWVFVGDIDITLAATAAASVPDGFSVQGSFPLWRGNVVSITGTGAAVNLNVVL